jgi:perosamine synthetase
MTSLQAALGVAQLRKIDQILMRKAEIADCYRDNLAGTPGVTLPPALPGYTNVYWLFSILIDHEFGMDRDGLISALAQRGIDSRPFFFPIHTMPPYYGTDGELAVASELSRKGICLPSSPNLGLESVRAIAECIKEAGYHA